MQDSFSALSESIRQSLDWKATPGYAASPYTHTRQPSAVTELAQVDQLRNAMKTQTFWKYHVTKLNQFEFYLTTNPDQRHKYARRAPSYYVEVQLPEQALKDRQGPSAVHGFRVIFTEQRWQRSAEEDKYHQFTVTKAPLRHGGEYTVAVQEEELVKEAIQKHEDSRKPALIQMLRNRRPEVFYGEDIYLEHGYRLGKEVKVGRLEQRRKLLFKSKVDGMKLAKEGSVYFLDEGYFKKNNWYGPLVAVFRPCKRDAANKFIKKMVTSSSRFSTSIVLGNDNASMYSHRTASSMDLREGDDDDSEASSPVGGAEDDYEYTTYSENSKQVYYIAKDGLMNRHPKDDSPNDFKLGWITVYNRDGYFSGSTHGSVKWKVVMGMTFAVGLENQLSELIKMV